MTIDLEVIEELEAEQLIVRGRYRIYPVEGGKPKDYTRATTWADTLEDSAQLRDWRCRMVAVGLGQRADLLACIQATPVTDKETLDVYCEEAARAAGSLERANWGTAAHGFFGRILAGELLDVPPPLAADVKAAIDCIGRHGLVPMVDMIEQVLVCEALGVAGRDDVVCINGDGEMFICDLKTGDKFVEYAALKTALQLSIYANADTVYDPDTRTHRPMPAVSKTVAYAIHRPLGTDTCQLIAVDIKAGWGYARKLAKDVRDARNHGRRKNSLFKIVPEPDNAEWAQQDSANQIAALRPEAKAAAKRKREEEWAAKGWGAIGDPVVGEQPDDLRAWILGRLAVLKHADHANAAQAMKARWLAAEIPGFTSDHVHTEDELRAIAQLLDGVEADFEIPFGDPDPTIARPEPAAVETTPLRPIVDEGGYIDKAIADKLLDAIRDEPDGALKVLEGWAREAHNAGHTFSIKLVASERRAAIYRALIALVPLIDLTDEQQDVVRATVALVVPDAGQLAVPLGVALGQLTIEEAEHLAELAWIVASSSPTLAYADDGTPRWLERF